uniref:F-box domain-containing protein n=1 Tax=Steinernema glaseri TaxID=37863 RepID=A0A1I7ZFX8_9BILA
MAVFDLFVFQASRLKEMGKVGSEGATVNNRMRPRYTGLVHMKITMDAVPLKFVDSVVELFGMDTFARKVRHPLWKDVVDLHRRNRIYYEVYFRKEEGGIRHVLRSWKGNKVDPLINMRMLREKGRFARIVKVCDSSRDRDLSYFDEVEALGKAETVKLLETISPLIDPVSASFCSEWGSTYCTRMLLTSLFKRAYFRYITLKYCGQIAYDFLEDQINNSPFLINVQIKGENWPKSTFELITSFCLKGNPGKRVSVFLFRGIPIDSKYVQHLFDLWRTNGNLQFELYTTEGIVDEGGLRAVMEKGTVTWNCNKRCYFFQHKTTKSLAILSSQDHVISCYTCECNLSEECTLKKLYPKYH